MACYYALLNQPDRSLDWLQKSIQANPPSRIEARVDTCFESLRADPRFLALVGSS